MSSPQILLQRLLRLRLAAAAALLVLPPLSALADYAVQRGDVLEISVTGVPALNQRLRVSLDGKITFPLLGEFEIADLSLSDLRQQLQALLVKRNVVRTAAVSVAVVEHRPIYVSGDVAKPGEYPYRPGMRVRQAAALAGSLDMLLPDAGGSSAQIVEARGDYGAAAIEFVRQKTRAARLRAELADQKRFDRDDAVEALIDPAAVADITSLEAQHLKMDQENDGKQRAYLERMIEAARDQVAFLDLAVTQQQQVADRQSENTARVRALLQRAVGTMLRLEDSERALAQAQAQLLNLRARASEARRDLEERTRTLAGFEEQRRTALLERLQDAAAESSKLRYRVAAAQRRARAGGYDGALQDGLTVHAVIHRNRDSITQRLDADLDTALQSGDVVEIVTAAAFQNARVPPAPGGSADADIPLAPARGSSTGVKVP
jgi:polysaccharide export outer membrane protein